MKTRNIMTLLVSLITLGVASAYGESRDHWYYKNFQWAYSTEDTTHATVQGSVSETIIYNSIPSEILYDGHSYPATRIVNKAFQQVTISHISNFIIPEYMEAIGENLFSHNVFDTITISCPNMLGLISENNRGTNVLILDVKFYTSGDGYYRYNRTFGAKKIITGPRVNRIPGWFAYMGGVKNSALRCVILSDSIQEIGDYAFNNCNALNSITLGKNINRIGQDAFTGCTSLDTIVWNIKTFSDIRGSGGFGTNDPFCHSTTTSGEDLRPNIKSFTLGKDVEYIPKYLCHAMGITSISIPHSVKAIGNSAFYNCRSLKSIYNYNSVPLVIDPSVFTRVDKTQCILYVPQGAVAAYQAADVWKDFTIVGSLTDFSPLLNSISTASAYLDTISLQEEYSEIADVLRDAIINAQNVAQQLTSTVEQVSLASQTLETVLLETKESVPIINAIVFENNKNGAISYCDSIMEMEKSASCIQLINEAITTIQDLSYSNEKTLSENLTVITNLINTLNINIEIQHKQEQLAIDKENFMEYKEMAIDSCNNLLLDEDSERVAQLIAEAIQLIEGTQYVTTLSYDQNQAQIDKIISILIRNIEKQRQKEYIHNVNQPISIQKVFYDGHMYILKGKKIYTLQGQNVKNVE